jgi:RNA-directed DNA polymerase
MTQNLQTRNTVTNNVNSSEMWLELPWKKFEKETYRLQRRIYKASQNEDLARTLDLQKLLFHSYSARMIALRQVTQLNEAKKTSGIDGKIALANSERLQLERKLYQEAKRWKHQDLRKVPIPKPDGRVRILKIPTISDRAWQCLTKLALEPAHEAHFHERSYGFRPGRSTHDAQKILFNHLRSTCNGKDKKVLKLDIEKCFDRISHQSIINKIIAPQWVKRCLLRCLQTGVSHDYPEQGTPPFARSATFASSAKAKEARQGGVISPLLANIVLNGIEKIHNSVRYADDMVFIIKPNHDVEDILKRVNTFLSKHGMKVNPKKTKVSATQTGFDFLGWNFKVLPNGKCLSTPSKENYKHFKRKVKAVVNNSAHCAETKSDLLAPIVRGWRTYHKHCDMNKHNLWHISHRTWKIFIKQPSINRKKADKLIKKAFPSINYSVNKFVNVKGNKSPFDGDLIYWSKRNSKSYDGATSKTLKANKYQCHYCKQYFYDEQKIELHHVDGNHSNWNPKNLHVLHQSCHDIVHHSNKHLILQE